MIQKGAAVGAMSVKQAAEFLGVSTDTLYRYANDGEIPAFKMGNRWRFPVTSLKEWMHKQANAGVKRG